MPRRTAPSDPTADPAGLAVTVADDDAVDHVIIRLGGGRYGLPAPDIAEVVPVPPLTRLPVALPWLVGVGAWRGHVLPVVDLRPLLALPAGALPSSARAVVVDTAGVEVGILAEAVAGLAPVPARIAPLPPTVTGDAAGLLRGLADGGAAGPIGIIDTAALLALRTRLPSSEAHRAAR